MIRLTRIREFSSFELLLSIQESTDMPNMDFTPDPQLQLFVSQSSKQCIHFVQSKFGWVPDYSESCVPRIEDILQLLHLSMRQEKPPEAVVHQMCELFGSYLGETYRRNHGGEWGTTHDRTPALSFGGGYTSFPWARVYKRLINGDEDNVHHWYVIMIQYASGGGETQQTSSSPPPLPVSPPPLPPQKKGFLRRFLSN